MNQNIGAAILIGGKSSRMGIAKDKLFLTQICTAVNGLRDKYISVNKAQNPNISGFSAIFDCCDDIGPIGGILSCLEATDCDALLILACDMPLYSKYEVDEILNIYNGEDILIPCTSRNMGTAGTAGGYEPLAGIYSRNCIQTIRDHIASGNYRLRSLFTEPALSFGTYTPAHAEAFTNINTPDEYQHYQAER